MKKTCLAFGAMVLAMSVSQANAESLIPAESVPGEFSASMALTTDYIFRGVSQNSDGTPAIQGSIDYSVDTPVDGVSLYAGAWGSNIEFSSDSGSIEIDYYGGFAGEVQGIGWDVGFVYFSYPGAPDASNLAYWEGTANLGYDFGMFALSAGIAASPDFTGDTGDAFYYTAGVDIPLFKSLALSGHFGHQTVDQLEDYSDVKVALSADVVGFGMELAYHDTLNRSASSLSDERAVFTISRSF